MHEWYRWDTLAEAEACKDYINSRPCFPITGRNSATDELASSKQKITSWVDEVIHCTDGKYGFKKPPESWLVILEATDQYLLDTYGPITEESNHNWYPNIPEEE